MERTDGFLGLGLFCLGVLGEELENECGIPKKDEVGLGEVAFTKVYLALCISCVSNQTFFVPFHSSSLGCAHLMMDGLSSTSPVLEADTRIPVKLLGLVGELLRAHGPAAQSPVGDAHDNGGSRL